MSDLSKNHIPERAELEKLEVKLKNFDPGIFDGIPNQKKSRLIKTFVQVISKTHIGPLPDPETLERYSEIIPDGANRVMDMAEKQQNHKINIENKIVTGQLQQSNLGQIFAFIIGMSFLGGGVYCIINGHEWGGSIIGVGGLTSLVTAFIQGKKQQ